MTRPKHIDPDGKWLDFRGEPQYWALLKETARAWLGLMRVRDELAPHGVSGLQRSARLTAFNRATNALPQLPVEWRGPETRYNRARWRLGPVSGGTPMHCEHPWSKKVTKKLIEDLVANRTVGDDGALVDSICLILDARQDTVLLPTAALSTWSVLSERSHDGLAQRYSTAVVHMLVDRRDGRALTAEDLRHIDAEAVDKVHEAFGTVAPGFEWSR